MTEEIQEQLRDIVSFLNELKKKSKTIDKFDLNEGDLDNLLLAVYNISKNKTEKLPISELVTSISYEVDSVREIASVGLRNDDTIVLRTNERFLYQLPENCYLFALDIKGYGLLYVGSLNSPESNDIAEIDVYTHNILQLGLIPNREVELYSQGEMIATPIIYQFPSLNNDTIIPDPSPESA